MSHYAVTFLEQVIVFDCFSYIVPLMSSESDVFEVVLVPCE